MAAKYVKVETRITYSENADYSDPKVVYEPTTPESATPTSFELSQGISVGTGSETLIAAGRYTSLPMLWIKNLDPTNYITVTYTSTATASRATRITAGHSLALSDVDPSVAVSAAATGAACLIDMAVCGET